MSIFSIFKHIFFPTRCICCGRVIDIDNFYCQKCELDLPRISMPICSNCGNSTSDCQCKGKRRNYKACIAPFYYDGVVAKGIKRFKFSGKMYVANGFASEIQKMVKEVYGLANIDMVCFVPMTKRSLSERGYNQSEILAQKIAEYLGVECKKDMLRKIYDNRPQHFLKALSRDGNVLGVFECCNDGNLDNKNVLLIDDVKTTGATLNECAKMLKLAGANAVYCACCAVVRGKSKSNI